MSNLIPFESAQLPTYLATKAKQDLSEVMSGGVGFPVISIKGKVFHIKRGDALEMVTKPEAPDEPAASIEVVILRAGPPGKTAKTFYATGYTEGSDTKPTCYSNDGVAPAADAEARQADSCALCPQNVWGSKITEQGNKTRACADVKRLAVAPAGCVDDAMLLRVPAASLKGLNQYVDLLAKRGVDATYKVVTKIGFDYTVAHPLLTFKPVGFVDEATFLAAEAARESDVVRQIIGEIAVVNAAEFDSAPAATAQAPKPAPAAAKAPPAQPKPTPAKPAAPKTATTSLAASGGFPTAPKASVKVEGEVGGSAPPAVVVEGGAAAELDQALAGLNFDD